jgi:23S rRNA (pseudouridine1915-N3)-methyltransferase
MKLRVVWVNKTKNAEVASLCADYAGRIKHFLPVQISEVKEARLLASLDESDRVVMLDPKGKPWTSRQLADFIEKHMNEDSRRLTFVVGDFAGLNDNMKKRADVLWSLSPLTFPHDLTRVILLEQIYRALTIIRNIPYSK